MTLDKGSINNIEKWLRKGSIPDLDKKVYIISSIDLCRAIENIKKSDTTPPNLSELCDIICNSVVSIELTRMHLTDALYDEEFYRTHVSKNENGLSLASYISLYYQEAYPEERDTFVEDIEF